MKSQKGFSLVSTVIAVAIIGVLASIAVPQYQLRVARAQTMEAFSAMDSMKVQVAATLTKSGKCTLSGGNETSNHKYGVLTVSGSANATSLANPTTQLDTGCDLKYTFNSNGASKLLAGKVIQADVFNNMVLSKSSSTNLANNLLPKPFTALTADTIPTGTTSIEAPYVAKDTTAITPPITNGEESEDLISKGTPYAYTWRYNQSHLGGQVPSVEVGCIFHTNNEGKGKVIAIAWAIPANVDSALPVINDLKNPTYKTTQALPRCKSVYESTPSSRFDSLPEINLASYENQYRGYSLIAF